MKWPSCKEWVEKSMKGSGRKLLISQETENRLYQTSNLMRYRMIRNIRDVRSGRSIQKDIPRSVFKRIGNENELLQVLRLVNDWYQKELDYRMYQLSDRYQIQNEQITKHVSKRTRQLQVQIKSQQFHPIDFVYEIGFLHLWWYMRTKPYKKVQKCGWCHALRNTQHRQF